MRLIFTLLVLLPFFVGCGDARKSPTTADGKKESDVGAIKIKEAFAGYEVTMPRQQAEEFRDFLNAKISEDQIFALLVKLVRVPVDWRIKAVAAVIAIDVILFKQKMNDNMGPDGVTIRVWGVGFGGSLSSTIGIDTWKRILPDEWSGRPDLVVTTLPLYWTITARTSSPEVNQEPAADSLLEWLMKHVPDAYPKVSEVRKGSLGEKVGLSPGDFLISYDGVSLLKESPTLDILRPAIIAAKGKGDVALLIQRGPTFRTFRVQGGELLGITFTVKK